MVKKAVLFDLDGTVLDTIADIAAAVNRALNAYGFPEKTVEQITGYLGNGSLMLMRRATDFKADDDLCLLIRKRFGEEYINDMCNVTRPYEGIKELFAELSAKGAKIAVITNKDHRCAEPMIKHYFGESVDVTRGVTADTDRKPNPEKTLNLLAEWEITPEEALFVGDGMADLEVAKNSGIDFVPVGYGYTSPEKLFAESGKRVMADVEELRRELLQYF